MFFFNKGEFQRTLLWLSLMDLFKKTLTAVTSTRLQQQSMLYILHVINGNQLGSLSIPTVSSLDCIKKRSFLAYVVVNGVSTPKDILLSLMANNLCSNIGTKTKNRVPFFKKQGV